MFTDTEIQKKLAAQRKTEVEKEEKRQEELFKEMRESFRKAEDTYYTAMNELPGGWNLLGMQVCH